VECDVAREALSARLDGERLHVPAARVDAHIQSCPACRRWLADATKLTQRTRQAKVDAGPDLSGLVVAAADATPPPTRAGRYPVGVSRLVRCALAVAGGAQLLVAAAQIFGADFGMVAVHEHGAMTGAHLLNESTAWSLALGFGMLSAAIWPRVASGVAVVLAIFVAVLTGYVIGDSWAGQVTAARIASHGPAVVGLVLIMVVCLDRVGGQRRARQRPAGKQDIALPAGASWGRRRGHVRPVDHSAA
jgi:RNA polymerase sigma-70 factor (ECF subfamily)